MRVSVSGDSGIDRTTTAAVSLVMGSSNNKNKKGRRKKDERPEERWDATGQLNRKIGEKQGDMGRPHGNSFRQKCDFINKVEVCDNRRSNLSILNSAPFYFKA